MSGKLEQFGKRVISGETRGPIGAVVRGLLRVAEPVYAGVMSRRNAAYDRGKKPTTRLDRPTISIGNITSGGTGKTPMVRWLGQQLINDGIRPAILLRGYRATDAAGSDEQVMLEQFLGERATVQANPDRIAGAAAALQRSPDVGAFILDDGFQHRRVKRDLDIVLISAIEPFGFGHVLPRGLLREPLAGLNRASAIVITHAKQVTADQLTTIKDTLRKHYPVCPIYHADHVPTGFRTHKAGPGERVNKFDDALRDLPVLAVSGLGDPRVFHHHLQSMGARPLESQQFKDHHDYTEADLNHLYARADSLGAKLIVTTEKDWVKIQRLPYRTTGVPIWRLDVVIRFWFSDEAMLLEQIRAAIRHPSKA